MLKNATKQKLLAGGTAIGIGAGMGSPLLCEGLAKTGFDFVQVDNQHGAWDDQSAMYAWRSIVLGGASPYYRVTKLDYGQIGRALDRGCMGIIVPMVNSVEDAREAVRSVRYPPEGGRSMGPFGTTFLGDDYVDGANHEIYLAVQIEQQVAAENAEAILGVEGIDGCWIGPADLGLSMGIDLETESGWQAHDTMIKRVIEACYKVGKIPGIAGRPNTCQYWLDAGIRYITVGGEMTLFEPAAKDLLASLRG